MNRPIHDTISVGQESVWDFPRPAIAQTTAAHLLVRLADRTIAETRCAIRTVETSHPPTYYFPPDDILPHVLRKTSGGSFCEWKGTAVYFDVLAGDRILPRAAWSYPDPSHAFSAIRDHIAFYAAGMDGCFVDGERVEPQPGGFYGGWITSTFVGPFKGVPGSQGW
jgi:uncharacterized protein (DUF427 family)